MAQGQSMEQPTSITEAQFYCCLSAYIMSHLVNFLSRFGLGFFSVIFILRLANPLKGGALMGYMFSYLRSMAH